MSQVVVTEDELAEKRARSKQQELAIPREREFQRWRRTDATRIHPLAALVGIALSPVLLFWSMVVAGMGFALTVVLSAFRILAPLFGGGRRSPPSHADGRKSA